MKLKHAESILEGVQVCSRSSYYMHTFACRPTRSPPCLQGFANPDVMLEQYPTGPDIAARLL